MISDLFESIELNDIARVQQILTQYPELVNEYSADQLVLGARQQTPLILAAELGQTDTVKLLLTHGADVHQKTTGCCDFNALFAAVDSKSPSLEVIKLLLDAGADSNSSNDCLDQSALSEAAYRGNTKLVKLLIQHGADINKQCRGGIEKTPLMRAAGAGHMEIVKLLLEHHADPSLTDINGNDAVNEAIENDHGEIAELIGQYVQEN